MSAPRRRRRANLSAVPNIGWEAFYLADTFAAADDSTIASPWAPTYGATSLAVQGTPKYRTGQAIWNGKPYVEWGANTDGFSADIGTATQSFVLVSGELTTGAPASSGLMYDAYDDGVALPGSRCWWQYQNTTIDQTRISAGSAQMANWAFVGTNTERLMETTYNGASSTQKVDGTTRITGDAGASSMQGLALIGYNDASAVETRRCVFVGRIPAASWATGRAQFINWYNDKYGEAAA